MNKKWMTILLALVVMVTFTACSAATATATGSTSAAASLDQETLPAAILKLEGTDLAVTAEQAKTLLPLWKAVRSLGSSDTASADEIQALYDQIQESLTAEQITAIQGMSLTQDDLRSLMAGAVLETGAGSNSSSTAMTSSDRTQGGAPGGGIPTGDMGGTPPQGGDASGVMGAEVQTQATPQADQAENGSAANPMTQALISSLIQMLEERAAE